MPTISRKEYASLFGPTTGDKIRLGETDLYIEIAQDLRGYGDEAVENRYAMVWGLIISVPATRAFSIWSLPMSR